MSAADDSSGISLVRPFAVALVFVCRGEGNKIVVVDCRYFIEQCVPAPNPCFCVNYFSFKSNNFLLIVGLRIPNFFATSPDSHPALFPTKVTFNFFFGDN